MGLGDSTSNNSLSYYVLDIYNLMTKYTPMKTPEKTLKTYRATWWVGVPLWAISFLANITAVISHLTSDNLFQRMLLDIASILDTNSIELIGILLIFLILLTYIYLLFWFILSTDWWLRNRNSVQISSFDKIRWVGVLLVLIIRPILIILTS